MRSFVRMLGFLRPHLRGSVWSLVLSCLAVAGTVAIPLLLGAAINAIEDGDRDMVLPLALAIVGAGILRLGLAIPRRLVSGHVSLGVEYDLRNRVYRHLQSLELGFFDRQQTGQLMSRATVDLQAVRFFLGYGLIFILQNFLTIMLAAAVMFVLQPSLAAITLAPVPLVILAAARYGRHSRPALQEVQQRIAELTAEAEESISGIRVVKAFAREEERQERFTHKVGRVFDQSMFSTRLRAFYNPMISFLPNLGLAAVLLVGGRQVINDSISLGAFVTFNTYMLMLMFPMRMLGIALGMAQRAVASGNRVFELLDRQPRLEVPQHPQALPAGGGRIRFDHVTLAYGDEPPALTDVTLDVAPGETLAIVGPTGSGKTTLVAAVARLYDVTEGAVSVDGVDVRELDPPELRHSIALVPDDGFLFSATVRDNIAYARPEATFDEVVTAAQRAQIHEFIVSLPDGYDTLVGERGLTLSGGQRQRIAIARAIVTDPRVLVLDDATASVDAATEREIKRALREVMEGRTTLVIAHRLSTIALADRVIVMEGGRITAQGTHEELLDSSELYAEIVDKGMPRLADASLSGLDGGEPEEDEIPEVRAARS